VPGRRVKFALALKVRSDAVQVETVENSTNVEIIFGRNVNFIWRFNPTRARSLQKVKIRFWGGIYAALSRGDRCGLVEWRIYPRPAVLSRTTVSRFKYRAVLMLMH
jgi:hypothetical protein